jgi:hypothetical protein
MLAFVVDECHERGSTVCGLTVQRAETYVAVPLLLKPRDRD